jgi:hypothetical protein
VSGIAYRSGDADHRPRHHDDQGSVPATVHVPDKLDALGLQYPPNPMCLHLQRAGVASIMNRSIARLSAVCSVLEALAALKSKPRWMVIETAPDRIRSVLSAGDLRIYLEEHDDVLGVAHLLEIPGARRDATEIDCRATVDEAQHLLDAPGIEALCIRRNAAPTDPSVHGVVAQEDIDNYWESAQ